MFRAKNFLSDAELQKIVDAWDVSEAEDDCSDEEECPVSNELLLNSARLEQNFEPEELLEIESMPIYILENSSTEAVSLPTVDINAKAVAELKSMKAAYSKMKWKKRIF